MERHTQIYTESQTVLSNHDFNKSVIVHIWAISLVQPLKRRSTHVGQYAVAGGTFGCRQDNRRCSQPAQVAAATTPPAQRLYNMAYQCRQLTSVRREFVLFLIASDRKPAVVFTTGGKSIKILILSCGSKVSKSGNDWETVSNRFIRNSV